MTDATLTFSTMVLVTLVFAGAGLAAFTLALASLVPVLVTVVFLTVSDFFAIVTLLTTVLSVFTVFALAFLLATVLPLPLAVFPLPLAFALASPLALAPPFTFPLSLAFFGLPFFGAGVAFGLGAGLILESKICAGAGLALASLADGVGFAGAGLALAGLAEAGFADLGPAVSLVEVFPLLALLCYLLNIIFTCCGIGKDRQWVDGNDSSGDGQKNKRETNGLVFDNTIN